MPVVTMMWIGGQRSLTAAASFSPSIEPGRPISVKMVRMSLRLSRTLIAYSDNVPTPSSWGKDTVTPQPQTTWWSKLREYLPEVRFETSPQPQPKTQAAVTPQPQSQWRSRLNEAWRWIQARLEEEWDKKPQQPQRSYVPPQRSYVTPQQNYVQPPQNPYQRIQMGDAQQAQQRLQKQLQFERSQGYDRYAPPPRNGWYPVNPRQNYSRQY
jgi:hypothetical protein